MSGVCLSLPCVLNAGGIARVIEAPLAEEEREGLYRSARVIRAAGQGVS